ncbi:MAG TPA: aldo/keto reductase [Alphaproteobacteria bacterium]|nr:aldo/keto reductase [Alphaproteobacteria bacterium]
MPDAQPVPETITFGGDLTVRRLGYGAMRVTGRGIWGYPRDRAAALALLRKVVERGVNFIDTADSYGPEVDELLLAEALHPYPRGLVIATKGGLVRPGPDRWEPDCRPAHLRQACDGSLKRLKLERIDLYQLHTVDPEVPLEDSLGTLVELQRAGKIRHIGLSNVSVQELARARKLATIVSVQNRYNLNDRSHDAVVDACTRQGLAFLPWYPLDAGSLTRPKKVLAEICARHKASASQIALAWLLHRSPAVVPIPGTSSTEHFEENLAAAAIRLSADEVAALTKH